VSSLDKIAKEVAEVGAHAGQSSVDDLARAGGKGAASADDLGRAAGRAATVGDKAAGSQSNAGQMSATNDELRKQGARESSMFDVWTSTAAGYGKQGRVGSLQMHATAADMSSAVDRFRKDPSGYLKSRVGDVLSQSANGASVVAADIASQASSLLHLDGAKPPDGVLQHVGLGFQILTSIEQLLTIWMAAIPFPAIPALRVTDQDLGLPHAHAHPPNLIPPAPVPAPLPSMGPVIPLPLLSGASRTLINGMPAARCGDLGLGVWCGGYFPMYEVFLGSSSVWIEGSRAARLLVDITKHCIFSAPKPSDPPLGSMVGMTTMGSPNVLIGGVPMPSLVSMLIGGAFSLAFKGLAKCLKKLRGALGKAAKEAGEKADDVADAVDNLDTVVDEAPVTKVDTVVDDVADTVDNLDTAVDEAPITEIDTVVDDVADTVDNLDTAVDEVPITEIDTVVDDIASTAEQTAEATNRVRVSDLVLRHAGFSDDVIDLVGKSPTMQRQIAEFDAAGGAIRHTNPSEKGSFFDTSSREIAINPNMTPEQQTNVLAHELGHATNPTKTPDATTVGRDEYVKACLRDEGYAQHSSGIARNEIAANGGSDIGPPFSGDRGRAAEYQAISNELQNGQVDHDVAMGDMESLMRHETTSTTGDNYADYYGAQWDAENSVWATP
jgi:uncharacterized Zn-binding protein involved in type VI secretion